MGIRLKRLGNSKDFQQKKKSIQVQLIDNAFSF